MYVKSVLGCSNESFDLQVLLQCFKKQLDLPSVLIDSRYGGCAEIKVVSKEKDFSIFYLIPNHDSAKDMRTVFLGMVSCKVDKLIG